MKVDEALAKLDAIASGIKNNLDDTSAKLAALQADQRELAREISKISVTRGLHARIRLASGFSNSGDPVKALRDGVMLNRIHSQKH